MGNQAEMTRKILHMMGESRLWSRLRRRHFLWPAAIGIVLAVGYNAALPLVISTTDVRPTMERMLDAWSGGKSRITGEPNIRFWPNPTLTLYGATIETTDGTPAHSPGSAASPQPSAWFLRFAANRHSKTSASSSLW